MRVTVGVLGVVALWVAAAPAPAGAAVLPAWTLGTLAGTGTEGFSGDGGPAPQAQLNYPTWTATAPDGSVYIADTFNYRIRKVDPAGVMSTVAGTGDQGFSEDGGPAKNATVVSLNGIAVDPAGDVYFADGDRIRKIDSNGIITTVAGTADSGVGGDGAPATSTPLNSPASPTFDAAGDLYFLELGPQRVRRVDANGIITTVAGGGSPADGLGDGGPATQASFQSGGVVSLPDGTLYIADAGHGRIRRVDTAGIITTVAGNGTRGYSGDGGPATQAGLGIPAAVAVQGSGNIFIADSKDAVIRRVDVDGTIGTVVGTGEEGASPDGTSGPLAAIADPTQLGLDRDGNLLLSSPFDERVRQLGTSYLWIDSRPDPVREGQSFTYRLTVSGLPKTATGTTLQTALPSQVTFTSISASQGSCALSGRNVSCKLGTVTPGTEVTVAIGVTARQGALVPISATIGGAIPGPHTVTGYTHITDADCGMVITKSTRLTQSIGPCAGNGIIVGADNVTLDLGGNKLFGFDGKGDGTGAGITLTRRHGVTVRNGTVLGFDGGVLLDGGGSNTVTAITARDNVGPNSLFASLGDGIILFDSPDNLISDNTVAGSCCYDGIGVFGALADDNRILDNKVTGSHGLNGQGIIVNGANDAGEATLISGTLVAGNKVEGNSNAGISNINNTDGTVEHNVVRNNGLHGIAVQAGRRAGDVATNLLVRDNQVSGNGADGIQVARRTHAARIIDNTSTDNGRNYGGQLAGIQFFDLSDFNAGCDSNIWSGNTWGSALFNMPCTTTGGSGPDPPPPAALTALSSAAPAAGDSQVLAPSPAQVADEEAAAPPQRRAP